MRWLQWSTIDLERGMGGVEVHARSLSRELRALGHETTFSSDPRELVSARWDVVQTHGSAVPAFVAFAPRSKGGKRPVRIHTLHGTTLGRMIACREWAWAGGYLASASEQRGVIDADIILTVNPRLWLARVAHRLGKTVVSCENGWDSGAAAEALPAELRAVLPPQGSFWVFVGRGDDRMKAADQIIRALQRLPELKLVAAPGAGFGGVAGVLKTGRLTPGQVLSLYDLSAGLLLPSRYEGNSLAILEALGRGVPVIATPVGGAPLYAGRAQGLVLARSSKPAAIIEALEQAKVFAVDEASRRARAEHNRQVIPSWREVAETALRAVAEKQASGGRA